VAEKHIFLSEVDLSRLTKDHVYSSQSVDWQRFSRLSQSTLRQVSRWHAQRLTPGSSHVHSYTTQLPMIRLKGNNFLLRVWV